jgi:hypothetical protein
MLTSRDNTGSGTRYFAVRYFTVRGGRLHYPGGPEVASHG